MIVGNRLPIVGAAMPQFVKGRSGNPGGRPAVPPELREAARARTLEALETLTTIMRDDKAPAAARVSAATAVLDRAWGKPAQSLQVDDRRREVDEMGTEELVQFLRRAGYAPSSVEADALTDAEPIGSA
jgi:hypothetical protein